MLIIFTLALALAAKVTADPTCDILEGGPSEEAKQKAAQWMKDNYIKGQVCPEGCGVTNCAPAKCVVCDGAYVAIRNSADTSAGYCITNDELDAALQGLTGSLCIVNVKSQYLQVAYGNAADFDNGGKPCENTC